MKKLFFIIALLFGVAFMAEAQVNSSHVYVNGHYRSNGSYVQGHYRTAPNHTINDNFSTYPNINPYTGKQGTVMPSYSTPSFYNPTSTWNTIPSSARQSSYSPKPVNIYNSSFYNRRW